MTHKKGFDWANVWAGLLWVVIIVVIIAVAVGIRLAITGGDVGCIFSQDPALCVAVKNGIGG